MYDNRLLAYLINVSVLIILVKALPNGDDCTEGFVKVDRMGKVGADLVSANVQRIFPEIGFTCNGILQQIMFGAGNDIRERLDERPAIQIWRPVGDTTYMLVHQFTLELTSNSPGLHKYALPFNTTFQAADIIGYYQPNLTISQFRLLVEGETSDLYQCFYQTAEPNSVFSNLDVSGLQLFCDDNYFLHPITDPPGCGCGFMSIERMEYVLDSYYAPSTITTGIDQCQQISPDMKFTCDGYVTKWIIGAQYAVANSLYPELQIWRNIENSTVYEKISGVSITMPLRQLSGVYEFDNFPPIAVKSGDILGISIPDRSSARLQLQSDLYNTPINYYIPIDPSKPSSHNAIDIHSNVVTPSANQPLVSIEFVRVAHGSSKINSTSSVVSEIQSSMTNDAVSLGVCLTIGTGISVFLLATVSFIMAALIFVIIRVKRKKKTMRPSRMDSVNISDNPAYAVSFDVADNTAYATTSDVVESSNGAEPQDNKIYDTVHWYGVSSVSSVSMMYTCPSALS